MYELFYFPGNASMAPHMALEEIGAPFTLRLVDRGQNAQKSAEYLALNPMGRIPAFADGELVMFESAAICLYLADRHPDAKLAPGLGDQARGSLYKWMTFLTNTIQPDIMALIYPERFSTDPEAGPGIRQAAENRLETSFAVVDKALGTNGPYLLGADFSVADYYLFMLARWSRKMATPARELTHIRTTIEAVQERPAAGRVFATEGLEAPYF